MQFTPQTRGRPAKARLAVWFSAIAIAVFAFGAIAEDIIEGEPFAFDRSILLALRAPGNAALPIGPAWLPEAARDVTSLGSTVVLGLILFSIVGYLLLERRRAAAWSILGAVMSGIVLNDLLKLAFGRPRPDVASPAVQVFSSSFPSGHATLSAIAYLTLGALFAQTQERLAMRVYIMALAILATVVVGISRIYLQVHYPSDVLAGWCVGSAWAMACWTISQWLETQPPAQR
jgi:undecaprenyl-diphosphatase